MDWAKPTFSAEVVVNDRFSVGAVSYRDEKPDMKILKLILFLFRHVLQPTLSD